MIWVNTLSKETVLIRQPEIFFPYKILLPAENSPYKNLHISYIIINKKAYNIHNQQQQILHFTFLKLINIIRQTYISMQIQLLSEPIPTLID